MSSSNNLGSLLGESTSDHSDYSENSRITSDHPPVSSRYQHPKIHPRPRELRQEHPNGVSLTLAHAISLKTKVQRPCRQPWGAWITGDHYYSKNNEMQDLAKMDEDWMSRNIKQTEPNIIGWLRRGEMIGWRRRDEWSWYEIASPRDCQITRNWRVFFTWDIQLVILSAWI